MFQFLLIAFLLIVIFLEGEEHEEEMEEAYRERRRSLVSFLVFLQQQLAILYTGKKSSSYTTQLNRFAEVNARHASASRRSSRIKSGKKKKNQRESTLIFISRRVNVFFFPTAAA